MAYPTDPIYKLYKSIVSGEISSVFVTKNGKEYSIPCDEANTDYQEYLEWAKTNTSDRDWETEDISPLTILL